MRCPSLLTFHIFHFLSETDEQNSTKLDRKHDLNVLYQVFVFRANRKNKMAALASYWLRHFRLIWNRWTEFNETWQEARSQCPTKFVFFRADRKNKMAALASNWLRHFRLLLCNSWTEFNKTWQEARSQCPLPSLCFWADWKNKMAALASDWLRHFRLLLWNCWIGFNETWQEARSQHPLGSTKFVFFGQIGKTRWPSWPLICWDIFYYSFETAERNSTKLDSKKDLNILYQVCAFGADWKNKMAALASDWLRPFWLLLWNCWTD